MKKFSILFFSFAFLASILNAQPSLPFYEPFSATQLGTLAPQNGWTGPMGVNEGAQVVDTTLTYSVLSTTAMSKAVRVGNQASGGLQTLPFASQTSEVFISFLINLPVLPIDPANASAYYLALGNGTVGTACMYAFPNTDGTTFELGFSPTPNQTTASNNKTNRQFTLNQTIMIVMASTPAPSGGSGSMDVWVNPSAASLAPGGTPGAFSFENRTGGTQTSINGILLRSGSTVRPMILDEIRVGKSWSDITSNTAVLPVTLSNLNLTTNKNISTLKWASETEVNFSGYIVMFSNDGTSFREVGAVKATGSNSTYAFTYTHNGNAFFKLKLVDADGRFVYSKVLQSKVSVVQVQVSPNPVQDKLIISGLPQGKNEASIYTLTGALVKTQIVNNVNAIISLGAMPSGKYVLKIVNNGNDVFSNIIIK